MMFMRRFWGLIYFGLAVGGQAAPLPELFQERLKSVVAVEFFVQDEIERHPVSVFGTVIDAQGTVILPPAAILPSLAADQLRDFKIYQPGRAESFSATYLGQDAYTGWHFVRVDEKMRALVVPITRYAAPVRDPVLSEELWGIGLRGKDEDFAPYFLSARVALVTRLPQKTAILSGDVAGPGLPVFNAAGELTGLAQASFGQNFLLFSQSQERHEVLLVNVEESSVVLGAEEVLPNLGRIPAAVTGRPLAWLGAYGLQALDPEVANVLNLENQSGVVLSDILADSPAARAGLRERDIVLTMDGQPLPRLKPGHVMPNYFGREILRRRPGDTLELGVSRDGGRQEIKVTLGEEPKLPREAERHYFARLGFTVREFLVIDGIVQRVSAASAAGVVAAFVKPGSPVATMGLRPDDWVREIDGTEIKSYEQALALLHKIDGDPSRTEFILLISRGGETAVLRVKFN